MLIRGVELALARGSSLGNIFTLKTRLIQSGKAFFICVKPLLHMTSVQDFTESELALTSVLIVLLFSNFCKLLFLNTCRYRVLLCNCDDRGNTQTSFPGSNATGCVYNGASVRE